jgi:hypothetical protein
MTKFLIEVVLWVSTVKKVVKYLVTSKDLHKQIMTKAIAIEAALKTAKIKLEQEKSEVASRIGILLEDARKDVMVEKAKIEGAIKTAKLDLKKGIEAAKKDVVGLLIKVEMEVKADVAEVKEAKEEVKTVAIGDATTIDKVVEPISTPGVVPVVTFSIETAPVAPAVTVQEISK